MKTSERVTAMKGNFINRRRAGIPIAGIAKEFQLNVRTVYAHLDEIAMEAGVSRDALLYQPHQPPQQQDSKSTTHSRKTCSVDPDEVRKDFDELLGNIDGILGKMKNVMEDE